MIFCLRSINTNIWISKRIFSKMLRKIPAKKIVVYAIGMMMMGVSNCKNLKKYFLFFYHQIWFDHHQCTCMSEFVCAFNIFGEWMDEEKFALQKMFLLLLLEGNYYPCTFQADHQDHSQDTQQIGNIQILSMYVMHACLWIVKIYNRHAKIKSFQKISEPFFILWCNPVAHLTFIDLFIDISDLLIWSVCYFFPLLLGIFLIFAHP